MQAFYEKVSTFSLFTLLFLFIPGVFFGPEITFLAGLTWLLIGAATASMMRIKEPRMLVVTGFFYLHAGITWALSANNSPAESAAVSSLLLLVVTVCAVGLLPSHRVRELLRGLGAFCVVGAAIIVGRWLVGKTPSFLTQDPTLDGAVLAALYPMIAYYPESRQTRITAYVSTGLPIFAVCVSGSAAGSLALLIGAVAWGAAIDRKPGGAVLQRIANVIAFFSGISFIANASTGTGATLYLASIADWWPNSGVIFGAGTGASTTILGPHFLDSDLLRLLFDYGIVGVLIFFAFYVAALRKAFDKPWLFSALFTYGVALVFSLPLRVLGAAFVGALLVRETFTDEQARD